LGEERPNPPHTYPDDSINRQVPKLYAETIMRDERMKIESALQLGSLENGFNKQQFRIQGNEYHEYENGWNRLLVFKNTSAWSADIYYLRFAVQDGFIPTIDSLQ